MGRSEKEETFRLTTGRSCAKLVVRKSSAGEKKFIVLETYILDKNEVQELIFWLISKTEEM